MFHEQQSASGGSCDTAEIQK